MPTEIWKYTTAIGLAIVLFSMLGYGFQNDNNSNATVNEPIKPVPTPTPTEDHHKEHQTVDEPPTQEDMDQALQKQQEEELTQDDETRENEVRNEEKTEIEDSTTANENTEETPVYTPIETPASTPAPSEYIEGAIPTTLKSLPLDKVVSQKSVKCLEFDTYKKCSIVTINGKEFYLVEK
jgi:hypothetical protein